MFVMFVNSVIRVVVRLSRIVCRVKFIMICDWLVLMVFRIVVL